MLSKLRQTAKMARKRASELIEDVASASAVIALAGALAAVDASARDTFADGEFPLSGYRAITLARDGRVVAILPMSATDEDDALRQATLLVGEYAIDLWDGLRFVDHFAAQPHREPGSTPDIIV